MVDQNQLIKHGKFWGDPYIPAILVLIQRDGLMDFSVVGLYGCWLVCLNMWDAPFWHVLNLEGTAHLFDPTSEECVCVCVCQMIEWLIQQTVGRVMMCPG